MRDSNIMDEDLKYRKWSIATIIGLMLLLVLLALPTIIIDPFFHYHKPLAKFQYPISSEWYQNDGIARNFDYDALITGTSMTENFMTSQVDRRFGVHSVKIPYSGASFSMINSLVVQGAKSNKNLKMVLRGLDYNRLIEDDFSAIRSDVPFPEYLYDDNLFDDVRYVLNEDVLFNNTYGVYKYTSEGNTTTSFDRYANWNANYTFGKETLDDLYERPELADVIDEATPEDYSRMQKNIEKNVISVARNNPQITFYYFLTPYSIYYFDSLYREGELERSFDLQEAAIKQILQCDNIRLFSFFTNTYMICDLDNYKDTYHYGQWINSDMLNWMKDGDYQLTKENYISYMKEIRSFYLNYNYDSLFEN